MYATHMAKKQTAAERVHGWRGHWTVTTPETTVVFTSKRAALRFAATMNRMGF